MRLEQREPLIFITSQRCFSSPGVQFGWDLQIQRLRERERRKIAAATTPKLGSTETNSGRVSVRKSFTPDFSGGGASVSEGKTDTQRPTWCR